VIEESALGRDIVGCSRSALGRELAIEAPVFGDRRRHFRIEMRDDIDLDHGHVLVRRSSQDGVRQVRPRESISIAMPQNFYIERGRATGDCFCRPGDGEYKTPGE
jgi:hypothetical protein